MFWHGTINLALNVTGGDLLSSILSNAGIIPNAAAHKHARLLGFRRNEGGLWVDARGKCARETRVCFSHSSNFVLRYASITSHRKN